jgi:3-oxoadipate enol-lactonase
MSFATSGGVRIFWRQTGSGEPLLLIMGFGYASEMWHHVEPGLADHFRVLTFDNRGVGRSSSAPGPHLMETLAGDAVAVLDAAGVETAHVFGVSMGGYIAQELALRYPDRLRCLVLGASACGGEHAVYAEPEVLEALRARQGMEPEVGVRVMVPYIYDRDTPIERIEADLEIRLRTYPPRETTDAQLEGVSQWESFGRLGQVRAPTLVLHGENDRLVPPDNGRLLAERIPQAELVLLPHASHLFFTDQPEATVSEVVGFLARAETASRGTI